VYGAALNHVSDVDQSIDASDGDFSRQVCTGTLRHLLQAVQTEDGPILNALSFPKSLSGMDPSAFSSEVEAWELTERMKFCPVEARFPVGDMRWGLAATRGARHWMHIDADGLGTFLDTKAGTKLWILFGHCTGGDRHMFGSTDIYLGGFDTNGINEGLWSRSVDDQSWRAEAVYLTPGTRL